MTSQVHYRYVVRGWTNGRSITRKRIFDLPTYLLSILILRELGNNKSTGNCLFLCCKKNNTGAARLSRATHALPSHRCVYAPSVLVVKELSDPLFPPLRLLVVGLSSPHVLLLQAAIER